VKLIFHEKQNDQKVQKFRRLGKKTHPFIIAEKISQDIIEDHEAKNFSS
jgi:hypothetical protein